MSVKLDWQISEEDDGPPEHRRRHLPVSSVATFIALGIVAAVAVIAWQVGRYRTARAEERLKERVQAVIDQERDAYQSGDGELFFANQEQDPSWLAAQLLPENQALYRAALLVTRVEQHGNDVWANIAWGDGDETLQRVVFFQWRDGALIHLSEVAGYWGSSQRLGFDWGVLRIHEVDREWALDIGEYVGRNVAELCDDGASPGCPETATPLTVTLAKDYSPSVEAGAIRLPSPRLLALDGGGAPARAFWDRLRRELEGRLAPAVIRFAVPDELVNAYQDVARDFESEHENISLDIVSLAGLPADPVEWPAEIDGAAMTPTEAMLAAGLVHDLTDYVNIDPRFDEGDFYEQIWQGAWWRGRMWFMPQSAGLRLVYYDRVAYRRAGLEPPSLRWTWEEMARDMASLRATMPEDTGLMRRAVFLDVGQDALFSYAYNWSNDCTEGAPVRCQQRLQLADTAAALEWYRELVGPADLLPDLTRLSSSERERALFNYRAVLTVDAPVSYEHRLLMYPVGVVPFPGSERFDGITPLWVEGSFIHQLSSHPEAVWEWLKFLSYQHLERQKRRVPARPSVASRTGFWVTLPQPLGDVMRTAFPFAQPVSLEEQRYFTWPQLAAVVSGRQTQAEAAQQTTRLRWFSPAP